MSEGIHIDQYPSIDWAKEIGIHEDGGSIIQYGLVRIRLENGIFDVIDGLLTPTGRPASISTAYFGKHPMFPVAKVVAEDGHPFNLEDSNRINSSGVLVSEYLGIIDQLDTGRKVLARSQQLLIALRIVNRDNPEVIEQIGVLEDVLKTQVSQSLPERAIEIARKFKNLDVAEFGGAGQTGPGIWIPEWVINHFSEQVQEAI